MPLYDAPADCQSHACALIDTTSVKALERLENALCVLLVKAGSFVLDRDETDGAVGVGLYGFTYERSDQP